MATQSRAAACLDLTRLFSRVGKGALTGIDRVENAYREHFIRTDQNNWACVRFLGSWRFLAPREAVQFSATLDVALARGRLTGIRLWFWKARLASHLLARNAIRLPIRAGEISSVDAQFSTYLNVGHSNLDHRLLCRLGRDGVRVLTMIHDTIPLDHRETQREGAVERFAEKLQAAGRCSDHIITVSEFSKSRLSHHLRRKGSRPEISVAMPGISVSTAGVRKPEHPPYFVVLGTIEPRKNIGFLLDIWERLGEKGQRATLHIVGKRGWNSEALLARLAARPPGIMVHNDLDDARVSDLLAGATALLQPSLAEGFGMPVAEAAALGVPVICNDLPVYREFMGAYPIYKSISDFEGWLEEINGMIAGKVKSGTGQNGVTVWHPPTWKTHFGVVSELIWGT